MNNCRYDLPTDNEQNLSSLTVIHTNCQSAMNKRSEISDFVELNKPHVLALTEFGAPSSANDGELGIEGYTLYRGDHSDGSGGPGKGAALYIQNSLNHAAIPEFDDVVFDCSAWSIVKLADNKSLLVGVIYRSPNSNTQNNENLLMLMNKAFKSKCDHVLLCGDFNLPLIDWNLNQCLDSESSFTSKFLTAVEDLGIFQHVKESTRFRGEQNSCLDLIFTNEESMVNEVSELPPLGKSDHVCQKWSLIFNEIMFKNTNVLRHNYKKANWAEIKKDIADYQFDPDDSAGVMNDKLVTLIKESKDRNIPYCNPRMTKHRLPWMKGVGLKLQRTRKWQSWRKFKQSELPRDYEDYKFERNKLDDMIRTKKIEYERRLITDMKEKPNLYHGHCRRSLKTKQGVSNVVNEAGNRTETEEEAATALNMYFHSVFTNDDGTKPAPTFPPRTEECLVDAVFGVDTVEETLQGLDPNKATGPDEIDSRTMKECAKELAPLLYQVYRKSMDTAEVPAQWKEANVVPIHKNGSKAIMANYRPVALTSVMCKVFEKILCAIIMAFLILHKLISDQQHGFVKGRSCQTNILLCLEKWTEIVDNGNSIDVAYFDYAKAFDKVSHRLLITKLKGYGIDGKLLAWLTSYLENRKQRVVVGDAKSTWLEVVSGTTQGTVLGFLLFLIFINDLPKKCSPEDETQVMILADDTKTYQEIHKDEDQQLIDQKALQDRINNIAEWADEWKMEINPSKSKVVHIGKENPGLPYVINGMEISTVEVEKDIGFWISNDLSTSTHVQKARSKALGEISRIKRNFSYIDKRAFCILYNQRVRPHLDYGMAACPPNSSADSKLLEGVQAKATAMVYGLRNENADERRKKLGLMSLEQRRERGDLIEVFKILKGLTRIDPTKFWEVREARNGARLVKELATNGRKPRQSFFSYRVIQKWNLLPVELKTAPSLACFKTRLDERILKH